MVVMADAVGRPGAPGPTPGTRGRPPPGHGPWGAEESRPVTDLGAAGPVRRQRLAQEEHVGGSVRAGSASSRWSRLWSGRWESADSSSSSWWSGGDPATGSFSCRAGVVRAAGCPSGTPSGARPLGRPAGSGRRLDARCLDARCLDARCRDARCRDARCRDAWRLELRTTARHRAGLRRALRPLLRSGACRGPRARAVGGEVEGALAWGRSAVTTAPCRWPTAGRVQPARRSPCAPHTPCMTESPPTAWRGPGDRGAAGRGRRPAASGQPIARGLAQDSSHTTRGCRGPGAETAYRR